MSEPRLDPARHARAGEIFLAACELPQAERAAFVERECGADEELRRQVRELLRGDAESGRLEEPALRWIGLEEGERMPERIGRYRVVARLGRGGMGVVYAAEQDEPRRPVAIKVLATGLASAEHLRRFRLEAEVLARLNDPGIAQVYDAGRAEELGGRPFFAMELVEGVSLTEYARREEASLRDRTRLLARVCDAVSHAHAKGVIHRDLKPANILVTADGQPKVLDFGVARAIDAELRATTLRTTAGELVGTLAYMSPEQVEADPERIDVRSDVYSLGVVAYELYTGALPIDLAGVPVPEGVRRVLEVEPARLGTRAGELAGDIDTIVAKALEKDPQRRYASVDELARDLRRHLRNEPIHARPPSARYQLVKFARRNRVLVTGVAATILTLAAGLAASLVLYFGEQEALAKEQQALVKESAALAKERAAVAQRDDTIRSLLEVQRTFGRLLLAPNPLQGPREVKMVDVLEHAAEGLDGAFEDRPIVRAWLLDNLGMTFQGLGVHDRAEELLRESLELRVAAGDDPLLIARSRRLLGESLRNLGRTDEALAQLSAAREVFAAAPGGAFDDLAQCDFQEALVRLRLGEHEPAIERFTSGLQHLGQGEVDVGARRAAFRTGLARAHLSEGRLDEAERLAAEALEDLQGGSGQAAMLRLQALNTLSAVYQGRGELEPALRVSRDTLGDMRALAGDRHPYVATLLENVAGLETALGDLDGAVRDYREVVERRGDAPPGLRGDLGNACAQLARIHLMRGESELADETSHRAVEVLRAEADSGGRADLLVGALQARADVLRLAGRADEARELLLEALDRSADLHLPDVTMRVRVPLSLALLAYDAGDWERAEDWARRAAEAGAEPAGRAALMSLYARSLRALALVELGRAEEALALATASAERLDSERRGDEAIRLQTRGDVAWARCALGQREVGEPELRAAAAELEALLGDVEATRRYRALVERL